jgi:hypothetical protein
VTAAALAVSLAACGDDGHNTGPAAATPRPAAELWNPCTLPPDVVRAAGVDPATAETGIGGVEQSGWKICSWDGAAYTLTVYSTGRTVAEFERKPGNVDFRDITIAGRAGRQFRVQGGATDLKCDVVFPAAHGVVQVALLNNAILDHPEDPCVLLPRAADAIVPALPR